MPAPPARIRSASVPCGQNSSSSSPARYCLSNSAFSPTYDEIIFRIFFFPRRMPRPQSSTPQLFETHVSPETSLSASAAMRFSGIPQRPNPPTTSVAPDGTSWTAFAAASRGEVPRTTLSIIDLILERFDDDGRRFAATDADRSKAVLLLAGAERVDESRHDARARRADRVAEGHRPAVHVHFVRVEREVPDERHRNDRERLVHLEKVDLGKWNPGFLGGLPSRRNGRRREPVGLLRVRRLRDDPGDRLTAPEPRLGDENERRGAVVDLRRVRRGHGAVFLEGRLERAHLLELLERGRERLLVAIHRDRALLAFDRHGSELGVEIARLVRAARALVALEGIRVLRLAREPVLCR